MYASSPMMHTLPLYCLNSLCKVLQVCHLIKDDVLTMSCTVRVSSAGCCTLCCQIEETAVNIYLLGSFKSKKFLCGIVFYHSYGLLTLGLYCIFGIFSNKISNMYLGSLRFSIWCSQIYRRRSTHCIICRKE